MRESEAPFHKACLAAVYAAERHDLVTSLERLQSARDAAEVLVKQYQAKGELHSAQHAIEQLNRVFEQCKGALSCGERAVLDKTKIDGRARGLLATEVSRGLWQAKAPRTRKGRSELKSYDHIVSCVQLPASVGTYLHVPIEVEGRPLTDVERKLAKTAAEFVCGAVRGGKKTIVLCADGKVASGLIVAMAMQRMEHHHWADIVRELQGAREGSIGNLYFVQVLVEEEE